MNTNSSKIDRSVSRVCETLAQTYGSPRLGNPADPLDDLVYIMLSNRTQVRAAQKIYSLLKKKFSSWDMLLATDREKTEDILRPLGFATKRTNQLYSALQKIQSDFQKCTLERLRLLDQEKAFAYLVSLPGVSNKVAKCVMLYTLGFQVLPVDSHVFRLSKRLGWTQKNRADLSHRELEDIVPPCYRYSFHVNAICHGRSICTSTRPNCLSCPIREFCLSYQLGIIEYAVPQ